MSFEFSCRKLTVPTALALGLASACVAARELPPKPTVADVVKAAKPGEWRVPDPDNTLYLEIPTGRVVIELAPVFAPRHVANIRAMVREGYSPQVGHSNGFPSARDPKTGQAWLAHCYGMVGVGRDSAADSGNGGALYAVIGNAPRHLDRNITVVGRVIDGMPLLSVLPRGAGAMGFYEKPEQMVPIKSVRLAADVPPEQRSRLEILRTESASFKAVAEAQRNRGGPWTKVAAGHVDLCNVPIPVRQAEATN